MTRTEEFIYINKLAWRLLRFKCNRFLNKYVMTQNEKISQQVWDGIAKYDKLREIMNRKSLTVGEARKVLKARENAAYKKKVLNSTQKINQKIAKLKETKGW